VFFSLAKCHAFQSRSIQTLLVLIGGRDQQKIQNTLRNAQEKVYLDSLNFPQAKYRLEEISVAHEKTCMWVLELPEYQSWMSGGNLVYHGGFFWVKAKPGAGKSTMMKYPLSTAKKDDAQPTLLSFFFHAQGVDLERLTVGMYRSLLHQILSCKEIPFSKKQSCFEIVAQLQNQDGSVTWSLRDLKHMFSSVIRSLADHRLLLLIDALDECDIKEIRDMINFLQQLGSSANSSRVHLRICLASRHYPQITIERGVELVLEHQHEHRNDMRKYVEA
jgi:hypothetical protein